MEEVDTSKKKLSRNKKALIVFLVFIGIITGIWVGGAYYFKDKYLPYTYINNRNVQGLEIESVINDLENSIKNDIDIKIGDKTYNIPSSNAIYLANRDNIIEAVKPKSPLNWLKRSIEQPVYNIVKLEVGVDNEKLAEDIQESKILDYSKTPIDAKISEYESGVGYKIIPDEYGYQIDENKLISKLDDCLKNKIYTIDISDDCKVAAKVTSNDESLNAKVNELNSLINKKITVKYGETEFKLNSDILNSWLINDETGKAILDEEKEKEYLKDLQNKFKTVLDKDSLVYNSEKTNEEIKEALNYTQDKIINISTIKPDEGFNSELNSINYVEVNITEQHVYIWKEGKIVFDTPCVSGTDIEDRRTHDGVFQITYKTKNAVLKGPRRNGKPSYTSPVSYWMPFDRNIGMHDATWRSQFGGKIYKTNGSHGCVNLPLSAAKTIYSYVEQGETVWVHH